MELLEHQKTALKAGWNHRRFLYALDMGLGKTFLAVNWIKLKQQHKLLYCSTFIVANPKKLKDWYNEAKSMSLDPVIIDLKNQDELLDNKNRFTDINKVYILSYQRVNILAKKKKYMFINKKINLIVDESQNLKNHKAQQTKWFLFNNNNFANVLLLSGDPISTGYKDLYSQMRLLNIFSEHFKFNQFEFHFCIMQPMFGKLAKIKVIKDYKNVDKLMGLLNEKSIFIKTEQVKDLPKQNFINKYVENFPAYRTYQKEKVLPLQNTEIFSDNSMQYLHHLRMLASGFISDENKEVKVVNKNKIEMFESILEATSKNLIVFYNYQYEFEMLKNLLIKKGVKYLAINGAINDYEKINQVGEKTVLLVNYVSGAAGLNLQNFSNYIIYYSPTYSGELYRQSLKRVHRIGTTQPCFYYHLITKNSIEGEIYKALEKGNDYSLKMFQDYLKELKTE